MRPRLLLLLLPLLALTACKSKVSFSDDGFARDAETGASPNEADRYAIHSQNGQLKLGLTDEVVYYRLSDKMLADVDQNLQEDSTERRGLGGVIAGAVKSGVSKMLRHRMQYALRDVKDIRYTDGQLTFAFEDGTTQTPHIESTTSDGTTSRRDEAPTFAEADVQRFIAAFRSAKAAATS